MGLFLALGKLTPYPTTRLRLMLNLRIKEMRWLLLAHYTDRHTELLCRQDISIQLICAQGILINLELFYCALWLLSTQNFLFKILSMQRHLFETFYAHWYLPIKFPLNYERHTVFISMFWILRTPEVWLLVFRRQDGCTKVLMEGKRTSLASQG